MLFADEANLALRPARSYTFLLIAFITGGFFSDRPDPVTVFVSRDCTRAAPGGTGGAKFAGTGVVRVLNNDGGTLCRGPTATGARRSGRGDPAQPAQLRSPQWVAGSATGGRPVDRRLWTVQHRPTYRTCSDQEEGQYAAGDGTTQHSRSRTRNA
ncbi:hypothetical protein [Streptomyces sp. B1I3]|uniref:hypothetical protein n=1 Tax=Streptomyces sp. B1I3 TaxID=3042264 RepID=UPI0027865BD7|nr:hypothetical protein [Streptomyces sp. B1I3]MDQ0797398.1 hypothetical protein [Streptomyces sp. B1I3]